MSPNIVFSNTQTATLALGILIGLVWSRRTGWSCGGIITPGLLALYAPDPARAAFALIFGVLLVPLLSFTARRLGLYGRERVGASMLLALCARFGLSFLMPAGLHWVGWVIPGLIAADGERQGVVMTISGTVACALVTVFTMTLLRRAGVGL